jgi:2,3-bisphosphoglycerate-dependent phosphoglycerate mutase
MPELHDIVFLRHAESEGNAVGYLQGQIDSALSERGKEQARNLALRWQSLGVRFDRVICSPLRRARQTAEPIAEALGAPVTFESLWVERGFGSLEGVPFETLRQRNPPVDYLTPFNPVGETGESQIDLYARALQALQKLVRLGSGRTLVVSHGAILGKAMYAILGITPQGHIGNPVFQFTNLTYVHLTYEALERKWSWISFTNPEQWDGSLDSRWNP